MPKCKCNLEAKRAQVRKEGPNKGRWFFTCPQPQGKQCSYFEWEAREPISEVEMSSRQYENIMRGLVVVNENLKAISKKLFRKGYIPVWETQEKVQEPVLDAPVSPKTAPEATKAPQDDIDPINEELAGKELADEEEKEIDLSQIPF
jgi:hypothetical protein